jgi:hypothetical protein
MTENNMPPAPPEGVTVSSTPMPNELTTTNTMIQNDPKMESGGIANNSSWNEYLKSLNAIEIGFLILGATSLYFIIYYYNRRTVFEKNQLLDIQKEIDEIKMNLKNSMKDKYKNI